MFILSLVLTFEASTEQLSSADRHAPQVDEFGCNCAKILSAIDQYYKISDSQSECGSADRIAPESAQFIIVARTAT